MNLLVTGAWQCAKDRLDEITQLGHSVCFMQYEKDELSCDYEWVEGVICNGLFLHHQIEMFTNLRYIQLTSAGYDRVPMEYVKEHAIEIHNAKGVYSIPMAEYAIWGVLEIYKQARFFYSNQKLHRWGKSKDLYELNGKTVAIIGCGDVGKECSKRFGAFGCRILEIHRDFAGLHEAMQSDIVIVTIALSEKTVGLIKPTKMKPGSILVSVSRGKVIDQKDLMNADQLLGAVLDVFEEEPLPEDSPLWDKDGFIITPHNSFLGDQNQNRLWNVIRNNLLKFRSTL